MLTASTASNDQKGSLSPETSSNTSLDVEVNGIASEDAAFERRTMRRVDLRLLPLLGLLYALALIDRTNLSIARVTGMDHDLKLSIGARYSIVSCIYFVPYILLELPSNVALRKVGARNLLTFCVIAWGAVQLGMGFAPTWGVLAFCRVLLGAFEAGFFPALVFIITTWYKRHEVQTRLATMYMTSILAGGFSAIFAYALSLLAGKSGLNGWSWIFIIEGAVTVLFGIIAWGYLPDFPDRNDFLSAEQTALVLRRVEQDRGDALPDTLTREKLVMHLMDWKLWSYAIMYMCATIPAYAIGFFITSIIASMGWSIEMILLLCAPPYVFAALSVLFFAWLSDKYHTRAPFLVVQTLMTILGLALTGFVKAPGWRYAGIFLANAGSAGDITGLLAYSSNNILSHSKRAVTTAVVVSFGGIGGVVATTIFRQQDAPRYLPGIVATMCCQVVLLILLGAMSLHLWRQNAKILKQCPAASTGVHPGFLYTL